MEGLALLIVLIWVSLLVQWLLRHDKAPDGMTRGLFALKEPEDGTRAEPRGQGQIGARRGGAPPRAPGAAAAQPHPDQLSGNAARTPARLPFQID